MLINRQINKHQPLEVMKPKSEPSASSSKLVLSFCNNDLF